MLVVGLTGGIGSGKSTVAAHFARLGVPVIDADDISRALVAPGQPALDEVSAAFGTDLLDAHGVLDRARLRRIVLADPEQRRRLEGILHPRVRLEMSRRLGEIKAPYCILSIPLLIETGQTDRVDRILVVDCPESLQRSRVSTRNHWTAADIDAMIAVQATRSQRLQAADDVLVNDGDIESLQHNIADLHRQYLALSG